MKEFVPEKLKNREVKHKPGIECIVILEHGNGSSITEATYDFALNETGKAELEKLLVVLPVLKREIMNNNDEYLEYYAEVIGKKLNMDEYEVGQMIDYSCRRDSKFGECCAIPDRYKIKFSDGNNVLFYEGNL